MPDQPTRLTVLGLPVSFVNYDGLRQYIEDTSRARATTIAFCNVHSVMSARRSDELKAALVEFDVTAPDGMPLVWGLRLLYGLDASRVHGPTAMRRLMEAWQSDDWRHFLLGSTEATLRNLNTTIQREYADLKLVGSHAPPFRPPDKQDLDMLVQLIRKSNANVVWFGFGMPKQELMIHQMKEHLPGVVMLGVGAAFDLLAGNQPEAPDWMKNRGLEWLFRLSHEPIRLWRRYLINNPLYLVLLGWELINRRWRELRDRLS